MTRDLSRLLKPRSVAVIGGGAWCRSVIAGLQNMGFVWDIWAVHPTADKVADIRAFASINDLPHPPDAVFIGVNRHATVQIVRDLAAMGAGGAVCFASGFSEAEDGADLNTALLHAAGDMPIIGPNCYGFINALDRVALWPDVQGLAHVTRGVAILTQSSNIALNLTMQTRGLPIGYVATVGNGAQTGLASLGAALLADPRVTALGLHIEGVGDLRAFEALAATARQMGKPIVVLKSGRSDAAQRAAISHTASLSGQDAGAEALLARLGMARVNSLEALLETLKLLHFVGPLPANQIASLSCSGGEAALVADAAARHGVAFAPLGAQQKTSLSEALGPLVTPDNPLDYHTFIWGDAEAMSDVFTQMMQGGAVLTLVVVDFPRSDRCQTEAWSCVLTAAAQAHAHVGMPLALVSTLPETMPEAQALHMIADGVIPLCGLDPAMEAIAAAISLGGVEAHPAPLLLPQPQSQVRFLDEAEAKAALGAHGLPIPRACLADTIDAAAQAASTMGPVALKARGLVHKSEAGGVALNLSSDTEVRAAAQDMQAPGYLVEEMIAGGLAEILIGVVADPAHGYVLTLGAGGVLTELWQDSTTLLLPVARHDILAALESLRIASLLHGYRGAPAASIDAVVQAVLAVQDYVTAQVGRVVELEVNPLIVTRDRAVAADAFIMIGDIP